MASALSKKEQIFGIKSRTIKVYKPIGVPMTEKIAEFAPRMDALDGKRIGLLWNSKPNGNHYLNRVAELLTQRYPSATIIKFWEQFPSETANPDKKSDEALDIITRNADVVISAQGD